MCLRDLAFQDKFNYNVNEQENNIVQIKILSKKHHKRSGSNFLPETTVG